MLMAFIKSLKYAFDIGRFIQRDIYEFTEFTINKGLAIFTLKFYFIIIFYMIFSEIEKSVLVILNIVLVS